MEGLPDNIRKTFGGSETLAQSPSSLNNTKSVLPLIEHKDK